MTDSAKPPVEVEEVDVLDALERAYAELCNAVKRQWNRQAGIRMTIPANEFQDTDLVIGGAIRYAEAVIKTLTADRDKLREENRGLRSLLNTPEIEDFDKAVPLEAAHQIQRWSAPHDAGKNPEDWFWLIGYLAGKALSAIKAGNDEKAKHHCISTAAALRNWHAAIRKHESEMRPVLSSEKAAIEDTLQTRGEA